MSFLSRLLDSVLHVNFDESPAFCLQQVLAWKERVALYQKFSGEQLSEAIMMSALLNGLTETTRLHLLLHLDGDSSFGDLETLLARQLARQDFSFDKEELEEQDKPDQLVKGGKGEGAYNPQPPAYRGKGEPNQLPDSAHRACKGKPKGKGQESDPSFKRELEHRGKQGRQNEHRKGKGEAYSPQPHACKGNGEATPASEKVPMVRYLLEDRAHDPSLLVEPHQPATRTAAPTAGKKQLRASGGASFSSEAAASGLPDRPENSLY